MAKEKEEVVSIDDEFGSDKPTDEPIKDDTDQSEKDKSTEPKEKAIATEAPEVSEAPEKDEAPEQVSEQVDVSAETKKTWKGLGIDDFEGRTDEEIAQIVKREREDSSFRRRVYGEQADELGELRKLRAEAEKPEVEEKPDPLDALPDMTEGEILDFNKIYEGHPVKAILKYGRGVIEQLVNQRLEEAIKGDVKSSITELVDKQRDNIEFTNFLSRHKNDEIPIETFVPAMNELDNKYFGEQLRPPEELFSLAKLYFDKDPLYAPVYQLMVKHPTFSFKEAQQFAKQQLGSVDAAKVKKEKIRQEIDKIDAVNSSTTASAKSQTKKLVTIDDEFEI